MHRTNLSDYFNEQLFLPRGFFPSFYDENFFERQDNLWNGSGFGGHNFGNYGSHAFGAGSFNFDNSMPQEVRKQRYPSD